MPVVRTRYTRGVPTFRVNGGDYRISACPVWSWLVTHKDYDGPEDPRITAAPTLAGAIEEVDELIELHEEMP